MISPDSVIANSTSTEPRGPQYDEFQKCSSVVVLESDFLFDTKKDRSCFVLQ